MNRRVKSNIRKSKMADMRTKVKTRHHSRRKVARTESGTEDRGNQKQTESLPTEERGLEIILESEDQNSDINTEQKQQEHGTERTRNLTTRRTGGNTEQMGKHFETFYIQNISERKYQTFKSRQESESEASKHCRQNCR